MGLFVKITIVLVLIIVVALILEKYFDCSGDVLGSCDGSGSGDCNS